ncbi:hypothetical protein [uncultured Selenomonas sp.]|uniref:hypothetical protein n=1 Tax=uncultured Selenomonas sp. TaxID=159275 RepID=UPI0025D0AD92|nr:hypothetical protein [uncultured Selenomonas sp.]
MNKQDKKQPVIYDHAWRKVDLAELQSAVRGKRMFLFGNSKSNGMIFSLPLGQRVTGIFDNNPEAQGTDACGIPVVAPFFAEDVVVLTVLRDRAHLWPQLRKLGYTQWFYVPAPTSALSPEMRAAAEFYGRAGRAFVPQGTYRYVHVIPDQKFIVPLMEQLRLGFDMREHMFVVHSFGSANPLDGYHLWDLYERMDRKQHNVLLLDGPFAYDAEADARIASFDRLLRSAERVIIHGEFLSPAMRELLHERREILKEKGILLPWSGRFGRAPSNAANIERALRHCRVILWKGGMEDVLKSFLDTDILDRDIKIAPFWNVDYTMPFPRPPKPKNQVPHILINHSCYREYNRVTEILDLLAPFAGKIEVYAITSYGDMDYREEIEAKGRAIFGGQFHSMREFMEADAYVAFLNQMDAAVFYLTEDASHTSIRMMAYMGVNFFFERHTQSYETWKNFGFGLYALDEIGDDVRIFQEQRYVEQNYERIKSIFDADVRLKEWKQLLEL